MRGGRARRKGLRGRKVTLPVAEHPPVSTRWHRCYIVPEKATHVYVYRFGFIVIQHCHEIYMRDTGHGRNLCHLYVLPGAG